jgi:hypothetical protein
MTDYIHFIVMGVQGAGLIGAIYWYSTIPSKSQRYYTEIKEKDDDKKLADIFLDEHE